MKIHQKKKILVRFNRKLNVYYHDNATKFICKNKDEPKIIIGRIINGEKIILKEKDVELFKKYNFKFNNILSLCNKIENEIK